MQKRKSNSDGFTLITTLLLLFLLSGLAIGMLMMVNTEVKVGTQDVQNNLTFHAAEGAIENMTAQLSTVLTNNLAPTIADITTLDTVPGPPAIPGITFPAGSYTLSPVLNAAGNGIAFQQGTVPSGNFAGLSATLMQVNLNATAQGPLGDEVNMSRTVEVAFIPVFQFGVFSDLDLAFFSSPPIDFRGRVHTNGDLYLGCGGGNTCTFHQKISAYGNVVRAVLPNGLNAAANNDTGTVQVPSASGGCDGAQPACVNLPIAGDLWDSVVGAGGNPPASAYNNGTPTWKTASLTNLGGMMINGDFGLAPNVPAGSVATGATSLTLPFVNGTSAAFNGPGLGNPPGPQAFEIVRRPPPGENAASPLGASRLYNEAVIRVLLSDRPDELPGGQNDPDNVRLANILNNVPNGDDYRLGIPTKFPGGFLPVLPGGQVYTTYFATASTAIPNPATPATACNGAGACTYYADWLYAPRSTKGEFNQEFLVKDESAAYSVPISQTAQGANGITQAPPTIGLTANYPYYTPVPVLNNNAVAGDTQWNLVDGYLRVEFLPQNGACPGPGTQVNGYCAVTREWLQLGFSRGLNPPTAPYSAPLAAGSNLVNPYAILLFQQPALRQTYSAAGPQLWPNSPGLNTTFVGPTPAGCNGAACTKGVPTELTYDNALKATTGVQYLWYSQCASPGNTAVGTYCTPGGAPSITAFNWYPINFYDGREGEPSDTIQPAATGDTCTPQGVMNAVELDVGNLNQWLLGNIPGSGNLVNNTNQNGYVLYFSDRRGMLPNPNGTQTIAGGNNPLANISGDSGFEDVVNSGSNTRVPDGQLDPIPANKLVSPEDNNLNGLLDNFGPANLGLGLGYVPTPANPPAAGTAYPAGLPGGAVAVNTAVNTNPLRPDPYLVGNRLSCAVLNKSLPQKAWVSGARHGLKLVDAALGNVPQIPGGAFPNNSGGFTVGSENPVYVHGNYNSNCGALGQAGCTPNVNAPVNYDASWPPPIGPAPNGGADPVHSAAAIIADTVVLLSNPPTAGIPALPGVTPAGWVDWDSFFGNQTANGLCLAGACGAAPPTNPSGNNRQAQDTYYRAAIAAGRIQDWAYPAWAAGAAFYTGTDGGVHNFLQFREDWGPGVNNLWYKGSMVNLFYSTYNTGIFKCCNYSVYTPPVRHYLFDNDFTNASELPPGTPTFRDIDNLSYRQSFTPCQVGANNTCTN